MSERKPTQRQKQAVFERARGCCEYCLSRADFSPSPFSAEHILARHHGGTNGLDNLALACQACNNHKFTSTEGLDPGSGQIVPLYHPRRQEWDDHFDWNEDFQMNRPSVINLRRVLHLDGKNPPNIAAKE